MFVDLQMPQNLKLFNKTDTTMKFLWDKVVGAKIYECHVYEIDQKTEYKFNVTNETACVLNDLQPSSRYNLTVIATDGNKKSDPANIFERTRK